DEAPLALHLAVGDRRPHAFDFRPEQLLDSALDVDLRRVRRHLEDKGPSILTQDSRLLGDEPPSDYVCLLHVGLTPEKLRAFRWPCESRSPNPYPSRRARSLGRSA